MRRLLPLLCILLAMLPATARAEEPDGAEMPPDAAISDGVASWMSGVDWQAFSELLTALPEETQALWRGVPIEALAGEIALSGVTDGETLFGGGLIASVGGRMIKNTLRELSGTIATLIGLALLGAFGMALCEGGKGGMESVAAFVCRCFTLTVVVSAFAALSKVAADCARQLCQCMEVAMPVLMTLLTALGLTASAGALQPAMALLTGGVAKSIQSVVIPLLLCAGVLSMFGHLSERINFKEMSALLGGVVKWSIGLITTLYTSVTALRGMTAAAFDGVSVRTAKYAAGSMFPMVGGLVGGSFDTVLGCAGLVKNAAGLTTILLFASIAVGPIIRIGASMLLFRLTAAVLQPVAEKNQVAMCRAGADMLSGLLGACAAVTAMFITTVGLAVAIGNTGVL